VKASVHGEALRALASDEMQQPAGRLPARPLCAKSGSDLGERDS
jgi:hypothetical protein